MRWFLALLACLLLGGCNVVMTSQPLATARPGDPRLRDGVWLSQQHPDCRFDPNLPIRRWPECSGGVVIRDGRLRDADAAKPDTASYVLSPGAPLLGQFDVREKDERSFFYVGLEPTAHDAQGRITGFRAWPVLCGPPSKTRPGPTFPGLTRLAADKGSNCTSRSLESVRQAATSSRVLGDISAARWVRDGDH
jgi:hypothetical protein